MTQTTSAMRRTMPRSWVMNSRLMPSRARMSASRARICACTVTSSAVVGSSAISKIGLVGERHRDHHALALAAGQLMRIAGEPGFRIGNADLRQQFQRPCPRHRAANAAVQLQNLADLRLDGVQRIERGHRLLEDDRNVVAADAADLALRQVEQFAALEADGAGGMRRGRIGQQLQDRQRADRFARTGFADQRHAFAALDLERDAIDRDRTCRSADGMPPTDRGHRAAAG